MSITYNNSKEVADCIELKKTGSVQFSTYATFFAAAKSKFTVIFVFIAFVGGQFTWSCADYFLTVWLKWEEKIKHLNSTETFSTNSSDIVTSRLFVHKRETLLIFYSSLMLIGISLIMSRSFSFFGMCLRISINLHDMIFRGVTRAQMIFFNKNPSGRILNRFAKDINNVDSLLPPTMIDVLDVSI